MNANVISPAWGQPAQPANPLLQAAPAFPPAMAPAAPLEQPALPAGAMDFTPQKSMFAAFAEAFEGAMDAALIEHQQKKDADYRAKNPDAARPAIGAGSLGSDCLRSIAYQYHRVPKDPGREPGGSMRRIFDRGHMMEAKMAEYLRLAGFDLITSRPDGKQIRFDIARYDDGKGRIKGMIDGAIRSGPEKIETFVMSYPCLWENKEVKDDKWKKMKKSGIEKAAPEYFAQVQINMAYVELSQNPALFTAKNADTQEIYAELIPFRPDAAQAASDKAARVVASSSPEEFPRHYPGPDHFKCKFCDHAERCWAQATQQTAPAPAPTWFGGAPQTGA